MKILVVIAIVCGLILVYVVWGRPQMRKTEWGKAFLERIEPLEIALWRKSETLLKARAKMVLGVLLTILAQLGTLDLTPLLPLVPDQYEPILKIIVNLSPMLLTVGGWVDEQLRKDTSKPLEVVELPAAVPQSVATALAKADDAKVEAVAAAATMPDVPTGAPLVKVE